MNRLLRRLIGLICLLLLPLSAIALCDDEQYYCVKNSADGKINPEGEMIGHVAIERKFQWWPMECIQVDKHAKPEGMCNQTYPECGQNCMEIPMQGDF